MIFFIFFILFLNVTLSSNVVKKNAANCKGKIDAKYAYHSQVNREPNFKVITNGSKGP